MYYTQKFDLFNGNNNLWYNISISTLYNDYNDINNSIAYDKNKDGFNYIQHDSFIYVIYSYLIDDTESKERTLLQFYEINLSLLPLEIQKIGKFEWPGFTNLEAYCFAVYENKIIIFINLGFLYIDINSGRITNSDGLWASHSLQYVAPSCIKSMFDDYIYIFGGYLPDDFQQSNPRNEWTDKYIQILKFDIKNEVIIHLNHTRTMFPLYGAKSLMARNGLIYLYGGDQFLSHVDVRYVSYIRYNSEYYREQHYTSDKTLIFNPITEKFEYHRIGINYEVGINNTMDFYDANSELVVYDDNILLFYNNHNNNPSNFYYLITNEVSINFTNTISTIWPSNGFPIKYKLNDFSDKNKENYYLSVYCNMTSDLNATIKISVVMIMIQMIVIIAMRDIN